MLLGTVFCTFGSFILALSNDFLHVSCTTEFSVGGPDSRVIRTTPSLHIVWMTEGPLYSEKNPVPVLLCQTQIHVGIEVLRSNIEFYSLAFFTSLHSASTVAFSVSASLPIILRTTERIFMKFNIRKFYSTLMGCLVTVKIEENNGHFTWGCYMLCCTHLQRKSPDIFWGRNKWFKKSCVEE